MSGASAAGGASSGAGSSAGAGGSAVGSGTGSASGAGGSTGATGGALPTTAKHQFSGLVTLDLTNGTQPIRQVLDEVLANLAGTGARVTVQLDVTARSVNPFPTNLVRTVGENARSLNFSRSEFS